MSSINQSSVISPTVDAAVAVDWESDIHLQYLCPLLIPPVAFAAVVVDSDGCFPLPLLPLRVRYIRFPEANISYP